MSMGSLSWISVQRVSVLGVSVQGSLSWGSLSWGLSLGELGLYKVSGGLCPGEGFLS